MSATAPVTPAIYGLTAEFLNPTELVSAAKRARAAGYRKLDAFSPMPIEELDEALALRRTRLPRIVLACGLLGAAAGMGLEYWASVIEYPMNISGRPLFTWPSFIPVAYEVTILFAALSAVIGMLALNGLPQPYHAMFNVKGFERASQDRFFLCIESSDVQFDRQGTAQFLKSLNPQEVSEVAW
jgi:hypothetical protein